MEPNDHQDEAVAAATRRTASSVEPLTRSLAAAAGLTSIPETWFSILAVAARSIWMDGNDYAHETTTQRIRVPTNQGLPVVESQVDNSEEPTVRCRIPRSR